MLFNLASTKSPFLILAIPKLILRDCYCLNKSSARDLINKISQLPNKRQKYDKKKWRYYEHVFCDCFFLNIFSIREASRGVQMAAEIVQLSESC